MPLLRQDWSIYDNWIQQEGSLTVNIISILIEMIHSTNVLFGDLGLIPFGLNDTGQTFHPVDSCMGIHCWIFKVWFQRWVLAEYPFRVKTSPNPNRLLSFSPPPRFSTNLRLVSYIWLALALCQLRLASPRQESIGNTIPYRLKLSHF